MPAKSIHSRTARSDLLRRVSLFATLSDEEYRSLEGIFLTRTYRKNQVIFREEETGDFMYIVLAGKVKVTKSTPDGKENLLAIHQAGDFFGEMALLDGKTAPATVSAMEDCRIASLARADFHSLLMRNEKVLWQMIQILCARLREAWKELQGLSRSSADVRIRTGIHQLSLRHGISDARGIIINLKITHQELADMVGTARETVSRSLADLQRKGIITIAQRRIVILNPKALLSGEVGPSD